MKKIYSFAASAAALLALTGCSEERDLVGSEGNLMITASFNNDVKVVSRASLADELSDSFILWVSSEKGLVRKYEGLDNVPVEGIKLLSGNYVAEAWAGDSLSASYEAKYYKARQPFEITSGTTRVELVCKIANVVTSVGYDDGVDEVLSDYVMTVGHTRGSLDFTGRDDRKGYFMMPTGDSSIKWTLTGKQVDGSEYTRSGVIDNVESATEYHLQVKYVGKEDEIGAGFITIEVDDSAIDVEDEIVLTSAPEIKGIGYDIASQIYAEEGNVGKKSVYISAAAALNSVVVESDLFATFLTGSDVDLMKAQPEVIEALENAGIDFTYVYDETRDISNLKLNLEELFTATLSGLNSFVITATDVNGKSSTATLVINVTDAKIEADVLPVNAVTTWATKARVTATILKSDVANPGFEYCEAGTSDWMSVAGQIMEGDAATVYADLTGLTPGATYEFRAVCDGFTSTVVRTLTTESAAQLPNSGFENWQEGSGTTPTRVYGAGEDMFWDSGNTGSAKMSKNVTTPSSDYTHSGSYSAKLESQFVGAGPIGAFAAGNIFVGQFLGTENMTKGILGWGRSFTSRPKALKGYIKYTPKAVEYAASGFIAKGDMDQGIIYVAIVDDTTMSYGSYSGWPQIVATKDPANYLFDKNKPNVIAYGEMIWTEATAGDGMVEFEIPLEYFREDVKASNIIVTCSASRYGDYYAGGPSVMYIDDFELVY